jgi:hypothetical protein
VNGAPNAAPAPIAEPAAPPPAPVAIAPVDPLTFTDDMPEFPPVVREALATPVDPELVETRATQKDGPEKLLFVPWVHYQAVLFKAFGPGGYRLVPRAVARTEGNTVTWVGALFVRIPGTAKFSFIKEAKGECGLQGGMTPGNAAEGAQSDCLVKCCKALGIFMELFDPRWRRAWEDKYRRNHEQQKRAAAWPASRGGGTAARVGALSTPEAAGDASPAAGGAVSPASTTPEPTPSAGAATAPAAAGDTGEAATAEQLEAVKARIKALAWKVGYMRIWFDETFGIKSERPERILGALTQVQADAAFTLLTAFNQKAAYQRIIGELRERGVVLR